MKHSPHHEMKGVSQLGHYAFWQMPSLPKTSSEANSVAHTKYGMTQRTAIKVVCSARNMVTRRAAWHTTRCLGACVNSTVTKKLVTCMYVTIGVCTCSAHNNVNHHVWRRLWMHTLPKHLIFFLQQNKTHFLCSKTNELYQWAKNSKPLSIFDERTDGLLPTVVCTVFRVDDTAPVANVTEQEIYL